ncbi:MAG: hypothetical protein HC923_03630 [Myxococcales bacterium]|nr:hypothetical protein [Myxococcales bacterium]
MSDVNVADLDRYIEAGWDLIPLNRWDYRDRFDRERGKSPRDANWVVESYNLEAVLRDAAQGFNVGVRLRDGDIVIDYDPRNLEEGKTEAAVLEELELLYEVELAKCPSVITGSGGRHWYMRREPGAATRNGIPGLSKAIELKTVGRQVVAAGSKHPNGKNYQWAEGPPLAQAPMAPAALMTAILKPLMAERSGGSAPGSITIEDLRECLRQIPVESYNKRHAEWLELLTACHSGTNGSAEGREAFVEWSIQDPAYIDDIDDIRYRWESFTANSSGGITVGTLFHHLKEAGGVPPRAKAKDQFADIEVTLEPGEGDTEYAPLFDVNDSGVPRPTGRNAMEAVKAFGLQPERDVFRNMTVMRGDLGVIRKVYPRAKEVLGDRLVYAIWRLAIEKWRLEVQTGKINDAIEALANEREYNCVEEYLTGLEWDGTPRIDSWLTTYGHADDSPYTVAVGRMFLLGCVGRALSPGIKFDNMIVLEGPQGCGKSTLIRILGREWTLESLPGAKDADVIASMQGRWIIEMAELDTMRRSDVSALKSFLARTEDRARLAYMRNPEDFPRRCVFVGTTNDSDYLRDRTGNRRFFPVEVDNIDLKGLLRDRDQLWAEAYHVWMTNPTEAAIMLPPHLIPDATARQEARMAPDAIEEEVDRFLGEHPDLQRVSTRTLAWEILKKTPATVKPHELQSVGQVMARRGWRSARFREPEATHAVRGYERKKS